MNCAITGCSLMKRFLPLASVLSIVLAILAAAQSAQGGSFQTAASLKIARQGHTATLLPNGKVLVAGGQGQGPTLATNELFDPATGSWSFTGNLGQARSGHSATLLADGKVLVAGGANANGASIATAEIYDPSSGIWHAVANMSTTPRP